MTPVGNDGRAERRPNQSSGGVLVTLRAAMPNLAPAERRIAGTILADPVGSAMQTISRLARMCAVSETTVIRLCRAIGLRGYPELRLALAASQAGSGPPYLGGDIDDDDDLGTVVKKIGYADARAVEDTTANLDLDVLARVVGLMRSARRIDIYGVGASGYVALDLQQKLQRIGRLGLAWPDPHMALTSAALLSSDDLAFGLSHTGTTIDTIQALRAARESGAATVALTNFPQSPIVAVADLVLLTAARETTFRSGAMASRIAQLTVVDCLFVALAQCDVDATRAALGRTHVAAQIRRLKPGDTA